MDEDCNEQLVDQRAEVFEQYLRDLDARALSETAIHKQEKFEHKNVPVLHGQILLNDNMLYDLGSLTQMQIWQNLLKGSTKCTGPQIKAEKCCINLSHPWQVPLLKSGILGFFYVENTIERKAT